MVSFSRYFTVCITYQPPVVNSFFPVVYSNSPVFITLPYLVSNTVPCVQPIFTRRTSGHCLGSFRSVTFSVPPPVINIVPALHPLHLIAFLLFCTCSLVSERCRLSILCSRFIALPFLRVSAPWDGHVAMLHSRCVTGVLADCNVLRHHLYRPWTWFWSRSMEVKPCLGPSFCKNSILLPCDPALLSCQTWRQGRGISSVHYQKIKKKPILSGDVERVDVRNMIK